MNNQKKDRSKSLRHSYSRDKPNLLLKKFIENHIKENPYNPLEDNYKIPAFDKSVKVTKADAIYNMHPYWSKKPYSAVIPYIEHFTQTGDLVFDPMCGSGSTALAALMTGRKAVALDISPAATFITKNFCTSIDIRKLDRFFLDLEKKISSEIMSLYETKCERCGGKAITQYLVNSQQYQCPRCLRKIPLYDCVSATVPKKNNPMEVNNIRVCPHCFEYGHLEEISTKFKKYGEVPVLISYKCLGRCKPKRGKRLYNDPDPKKHEYFQKFDLGKIKEIQEKEIPYWYPPHRMMNITSDTKPWGDKWRAGTSNFRTVAELYTKRNLFALSIIRKEIMNANYEYNMRDIFLFMFNAILFSVSRMIRESNTQTIPGTYYFPPISKEVNVLSSFRSRKNRIIKGLKKIKLNSDELLISTENATNLINIISDSVDYIFTDPPYMGKYQYGELNFIWEAWLQFDTSWHKNEIIINKTRNISKTNWISMMKCAMSEAYRVLKPGRWISLCYHDTSEGSWQLVQDIMMKTGFAPELSDSVLYIDTNQKSYNQYTANKVTKRDLVINFRKPKPGETSAYISFSGEEDSRTFNQKILSVITDHLVSNPGATKDRVYDELVSRMVRRGEMQPHDFDMLLKQVAEPSTAQNSSGSVERWYLKETQINTIDQAETAREDAAAESVTKFIAKSIESNPAEEGVHYSDIFEHYIYAVQDKPRRELRDWLIDYFYVTPEGTYRPPMTDEEERLKREGRDKGLSRRIRRFVSMLENGVPVPAEERPDGVTLVEWILHCRRSGLYSEGRVLYERGGLSFDDLSEETQIEVEEAYYSIAKKGV